MDYEPVRNIWTLELGSSRLNLACHKFLCEWINLILDLLSWQWKFEKSLKNFLSFFGVSVYNILACTFKKPKVPKVKNRVFPVFRGPSIFVRRRGKEVVQWSRQGRLQWCEAAVLAVLAATVLGALVQSSVLGAPALCCSWEDKAAVSQH